ncbi:hypothetical protein [Paenibacillus mendelii]|uniref:DUF4247 domain-containing protein n=1 Tax=Paenibacillus mendelii TaxID=206163 RepID=A0ABV6J3Y8_9BACL|nr:hypothetical protein [Paenibacillus mendelii]MCQ6562046.1 hypothetical protein [Paenibacillus mendelii]
MTREEDQAGAPTRAFLFNKEGKPLRVLSTSLGIALLANAFMSGGLAERVSAEPGTAASAAGEPKLVEWSTEAVKAFYDPSVDWNIPLPQEEGVPTSETEEEEPGSGGSSGGTTVIHTNSGFGWDDLLLYHLIFNRGSAYSSTSYYANNRAYDARTGTAYKPRSYTSETFQNKPVVGSAVRPRTSDTTGSVTRRSTSSTKGGIGGRSSGFSSSSSSSGRSSSSGFGG